MTEKRRAVVFFQGQLSRDRHQGEDTIIGNPRAGLVRLANAANHVLPILIEKGIRLRLRVGRPRIHGKRHGDGRILIAMGKLAARIGSLQRVGEQHRRFLPRHRCYRTQPTQRPNESKCFHKLEL
jgi:hypothetical protein